MRIIAEDIERLLKAKYNDIHIKKIEEKQAGGQGVTFFCSWESHRILNNVFLKVIDIKTNVMNKFYKQFPNYSDSEWVQFAYEQIPRFEEESDYYRSFSDIKEVVNIYDSWIDSMTFKPYPVMVISFEPKEGDISNISIERRTEALGMELCYSVVKGLYQMNKRVTDGVFLHKDIKQENILYDVKNGAYIFYIADLGVSKAWNKSEFQWTIVNHDAFGLPDNIYTAESDIYLIGMLLYAFFNGWNTKHLAAKLYDINKREKIFDGETGEFLLHKPENILNENFWQLIKKMLHREKEERPTLEEICGYFERIDTGKSEKINESVKGKRECGFNCEFLDMEYEFEKITSRPIVEDEIPTESMIEEDGEKSEDYEENEGDGYLDFSYLMEAIKEHEEAIKQYGEVYEENEDDGYSNYREINQPQFEILYNEMMEEIKKHKISYNEIVEMRRNIRKYDLESYCKIYDLDVLGEEYLYKLGDSIGQMEELNYLVDVDTYQVLKTETENVKKLISEVCKNLKERIKSVYHHSWEDKQIEEMENKFQESMETVLYFGISNAHELYSLFCYTYSQVLRKIEKETRLRGRY